jgi:DoxX-like family
MRFQTMYTPGERTGGAPLGSRTPSGSQKGLWAGRIMSGLAALFLLFDSLIKVMKLAPAVEGTTALGYPANVVRGIGIVELVCLVLYVIPRTSVFGAILLTGYLGGAVATHVRVGSPLFTHILFPIYVAALIWGGLYLRDARLRSLVPLR